MDQAPKEALSHLAALKFQRSRQKAWNTLYDLASFTRQSFEASKQFVPKDGSLTSFAVDTAQQESWGTQSQHSAPGSIPDAAHDVAQRVMRLQLQLTADPAFSSRVPHLCPSGLEATFFFTFLQTLKDLLHNNEQWDEWLNNKSSKELPCYCDLFRDLLSDDSFVGEQELKTCRPSIRHVGFLGQEVLPPHFFHCERHFFEPIAKFERWRRKQGLPAALAESFNQISFRKASSADLEKHPSSPQQTQSEVCYSL